MANLETLRPKPFTSEYQPENRGRPKGSKNRATLLKKWLSVELDIVDPNTKQKHRGTVEDEVILALIKKAKLGDVAAVREALDSVYGKVTDKLEVTSDIDTQVERFVNRLREKEYPLDQIPEAVERYKAQLVRDETGKAAS